MHGFDERAVAIEKDGGAGGSWVHMAHLCKVLQDCWTVNRRPKWSKLLIGSKLCEIKLPIAFVRVVRGFMQNLPVHTISLPCESRFGYNPASHGTHTC